ncbi:hypothetical protein [Martelella limonii]|uniref:hypothetical protein n=1 Tax=Martelella limonii TaxID=1647649 RepID=UPI001580B298|nr:hypothetical protein [Martelella limonii]
MGKKFDESPKLKFIERKWLGNWREGDQNLFSEKKLVGAFTLRSAQKTKPIFFRKKDFATIADTKDQLGWIKIFRGHPRERQDDVKIVQLDSRFRDVFRLQSSSHCRQKSLTEYPRFGNSRARQNLQHPEHHPGQLQP